MSAVVATYVVLGGVLSFAGWAFGIQRLTDWEGSGISIQPNPCLAVTAAGAALFLLDKGKRRVASILGTFVALVGGTVVFQYLSGVDLRIDTPLMFERTWGRVGVLSPGRMGPAGATSWTLIGIAFVLASRPTSSRARRFAPALALVTTGISSLGLIGYLYGASTLYSLPHSTVIALQTASFIFAVSIGLLLSVAEHGPLQILEEQGARVACVRSTDLALGALSRERFDVIVSDIGMPGRDGYELLRETRRRGIHTPAIALTAFARDDDRKKALAAGYDAHVEKPVETHVLLDAVRKWGRRPGTGDDVTDTQGAAS